MDSLTAPIRSLSEEAAWFARANEVRLLHVVCATDLRDAALKVLLAQEFHEANRAPYVQLDDAFTADAPGWVERALRLRAHHAARLKSQEDPSQGQPLGPAPHGPDPLTAFALQVRQLVDTPVPPTAGLVVVLAPTRIERSTDWATAVRVLVTSPRLADVRWIVVEIDQPALGSLATSLGKSAMTCTMTIDEAALDRDLAAMLDAAAEAPASAPGPALMGAAWPQGVVPPRRRGQPVAKPAELKAAMIAAGVEPAVTPDEAHGLRVAVLRAAQALKAGRGPEAVRQQREARDLCDRLQLPELSVAMELILGTYLIQLGQVPLAIETLQACSARAEKANMPKEVAQAQLALGALTGVQGRADESAVAYSRAGDFAQRAGIPLLAIEAYRLAGTLCPRIDLKIELWKRALDLAGELPPSEQKASSAAETARTLAQLLRKRGLVHQAADLERQSIELEAGEVEDQPAKATGT